MEKDMKTILITGASSGIGEALALHYAGTGVRLFLSGRNRTRLEKVAHDCRNHGAETHTSVMDVTDRVAMQDWIGKADDQSPLDLVIANAGISSGTGSNPQGEPLAQAREIFAVNLDGVLNTVEPALERMIARKNGQIALMSSLAAYRGWPGAPSYCASKAAVRFYGESMRGKLARNGVKINVICPGFIKSRMTDANDFPMPCMMDAGKAARIIARGLEKNKGRIAFPWPTLFIAWFLSVLPDSVAQAIMQGFPAKGENRK